MYVFSCWIDHPPMEPVSHSDEAPGHLLHYLTTHHAIQGIRPIANTVKQTSIGAFPSSPGSVFKRQVAKPKAVLKPVGKKSIYLHFFIGVMHKAVWVVVDWRYLRVAVAADDLDHGGVVVYPHSHPWVVEPTAAIVGLFEQQGFGKPGRLQHLDSYPAQIFVFTVQFNITHGAPVDS